MSKGNTQVLVDNAYATLVYRAADGIVHHTFHQPIGGEAFREVLNRGVEQLQANGATKWLSDDRKNARLSDEDTVWSQEDWFPRARAAGWGYWAIVLPPDTVARINYSEFVFNYAQKGVRVGLFSAADEALDWLRTVEETDA